MDVGDFQKEYLSQDKIFAHLDRVQEWLKKDITKPIVIEIDPTNFCNFNCRGCAGNKFSPKSSLSLEFMKNVINQISPFCKGLVFTGGGEPLMNEDILKVIDYAKKKNIDIGLITNGSLINEENAEGLVKNCSWIRISVDASSFKKYSNLKRVGKEKFDNVWKGINLLIKFKQKLNSNCTIGMGYLVSRKNSKEIISFIKRAKKLGVDYVQFRPFHYLNYFPKRILQRAKKLESKNFKVLATMHRFLKEEGNFERCFKDEFTTIINAEGKMYPCCFTRGMKEFCFGDLNKDSFKKIWGSDKRKEIFKEKLKSKNCPVMCRYDSLNKLLWNIWKINKEGKHLNFL